MSLRYKFSKVGTGGRKPGSNGGGKSTGGGIPKGARAPPEEIGKIPHFAQYFAIGKAHRGGNRYGRRWGRTWDGKREVRS